MEKRIKKYVLALLCIAISFFMPIADIENSNIESAFAEDSVTTEKTRREVLVSGESIGIAMMTDGLIVTKVTEVSEKSKRRVYPAADAGIRPGDMLVEFDGTKIKNADHISELVKASGGNTKKIKVNRNGEFIEFDITPALDWQSSEYKLGVLVKDSTSGIGTLTFVEPKTLSYGALGHAIADAATGVTLPSADGNIISALINNVVKGKQGKPGELQGTFSLRNPRGNIAKNNEFGIFGKITDGSNLSGMKLMPVAYQSEIEIGEAEILCTVDGSGVNAYKINITKITSQNSQASKGMVIEVTDDKLIAKTGGIVQGMSGSPIIQNGRIVGAVTHVMVNNPKKGYGVFAEWMLEEADKVG